MKAYFKCKILKTTACLSRKASKLRDIKIDKDNLIRDLQEALEICVFNFGLHGRTIDCHLQLGKMFWFLGDIESAMASFDKATEMAGSLPISHNKRYISSSIEKGRFLIDCKSKEYIMEGKRILEETLHDWKDFCGKFMWFEAMGSLLRVNRTKCDEVADEFLKERRLFHPSLRAMYSAVIAQLDDSNEEINEKNFIPQETSMVGKLVRVIDHLENLCKDDDHKDEKLLQDAIKYTYLWNMWIATRFMHALSKSEIRQCASKALEVSKSYSFIRNDRYEQLSFLMDFDDDDDDEKFVLLKNRCHIEQMGKKIPAKKDDLEKELEKLLIECEKYQDVWSWVIEELAREKRKLYERVTPYLLRQSEPNENLLKLVLHKFVYEIEAYKRDSNAGVTPEESIPAVKDILRAINHIEDLSAKRNTMQEDISRAQKDALKSWYTQLAVRTKECLSRANRSRYARKALSLLEEGDACVTDKERQIVTKLAS